MPSWGIELELHGISLELRIHRIVIDFGIPGHVNDAHYQLNRDPKTPIHIGLNQLKEIHSLKSLIRNIAYFLDKQGVPKHTQFQNLEQGLTLINIMEPIFFSLYKSKIEMLNPPFAIQSIFMKDIFLEIFSFLVIMVFKTQSFQR